MVAISVEDVKKVYKVGKVDYVALRGVSIKIDKGSFCGIIGPSGSGKTTLLNLIGCLDIPTEGKIFIEGKDLTMLSQKQLEYLRREKIGFIFQTFNLMQALTVYENIEFPLLFSNVGSKIRKQKTEQLIEKLGLIKIARHKAVDISGGEQQRTAIARALIKDPLIILADEPTGNLDIETSTEILNMMEKLNKETNVTLLVVSHNPMILNYTNIVFKLIDGELARNGKDKNIY